ncbi:MAG: flavin reductase family protein [Elusimicrobiota bacterium]|jgi:flavin reductase (DIM6/NTAB) family NADH-FMN oxidoreductase RutF
MKRAKIEFFEGFPDLCKAMPAPGAFLLVSAGGKSNVMTIGWACLGVVWGEPVLEVLVRPSRHTFGLMEAAQAFSVNVPVGKLQKKLAFCGAKSGRDTDKFEACGLHLLPGLTEGVSVIDGCDLYFECLIIHKTRVIKENLDPKIVRQYYPGDDFHTIYSGRVLETYRG